MRGYCREGNCPATKHTPTGRATVSIHFSYRRGTAIPLSLCDALLTATSVTGLLKLILAGLYCGCLANVE